MARLPLIAFALGLVVSTASGQDPAARALAFNEQAVAAAREGDLEGAMSHFRRALELAPDQGTIRLNASRCLVRLGDQDLRAERFEEAARDYDEAAELDPRGFEPKHRQAMVHYRKLRDREALALLEPLVRDHPKQAPGHELLGLVLYRAGENRRAIEHWTLALALGPDSPQVRALLEKVKREEQVEEDLYVDLSAPHFSIKYDGAKDVAVGRLVAQVLEAAYESVGARLGRFPRANVSVVIYPDKTFRETTGAHGWVAGLYDGKIRVPAGGLAKASPQAVQRVLTHEYTHALLMAVGGRGVPVWLHEGFAQVAQGRGRADAQRHVRAANAPSLSQISGSFARIKDADTVRILYAASCDLVHSLLAQGGSPPLAEVLDALGRGARLDDALVRAYGQTLAELHAAWKRSLPQ